MISNNSEKVISNYLNNSTFTACSLGVAQLLDNDFSESRVFSGRISRESGAKSIDEKTLFDLASLTKPLVTVLSLLSLMKDRDLHLEENLASIFPNQIPEDKKKITIKQLLNHHSGLPAHKRYFESIRDVQTKVKEQSLINLILNEKLENRPGEKYIYSDLDYMLLGAIIEQKSGVNLASYWRNEIVDKGGFANDFYSFDEDSIPADASFAITGHCPWSNNLLRGRVHDDNCRAFGRMMGHAGLFSTLDGVMYLCKLILTHIVETKNHPAINIDDLQYLVQPRQGLHWAHGFDVPTGTRSSSGRFFSKRTIGHLGYTGTSFWIDLEKCIIVVLLTNRVIFGDDQSKIKEFRPVIHDKVMDGIQRAIKDAKKTV